MKYFMIFRPGWWALHAAAITFAFWLGHAVKV